MPTVREVEDKYTVGGGFTMPDLSGIEGVGSIEGPETVELSATYFDTADLRLIRNHLTLRRRTGGADQGWHLKLPASGGRDEVQRPLGRGKSVPAELADLVLARTRRAALAPVARVETRRTIIRLLDADGAVLAEVADDDVRAAVLEDDRDVEVTSWRELEVELVGAGRDLLATVGDALEAAGAQPASYGSKVALVLGQRVPPPDLPQEPPARQASAADVVKAYLVEHLETMLAYDPRVRLDEPDSVHKMRVSTRRLRSTLRTFRPMLDDGRARDLDARLKDLAATLGVPRDREVQLERLLGHLDALPDELVLGPVRRRIEERLGGDRLRGHDEALAALRSPEYLTLVDDLLDFVNGPPTATGDKPAGKVLPALVRKRYKRLARRMSTALEPLDVERDEHLHAARKTGKQVRYAAEALIPLHGKDAKKLAKRVEDVQEVLGDHQDSVVARPLIRELAVATAKADDESAFTHGLLYAREQQVAAEAEAQVERVWRKTSARKHRRFLR